MFSCFGIVSASANSEPEASSTTIYVTAPSVGATPSPYDIGKSNNLIVLQGYTWAERAPGESSYHVMSGSFKEGYRYRIYIDYASPEGNLDDIVIYVNGDYPTGRSDDNYIYGTLYYDFGTLGSSSGGSSSSSENIFLEILLFPIKILSYPLFLIGTILGLI